MQYEGKKNCLKISIIDKFFKLRLKVKPACRQAGVTKEATSKASYSVIPACRESFYEEGLRTSRNDKQCGLCNGLISTSEKLCYLQLLTFIIRCREV